MQITVTEDDIEQGVALSVNYCPVARAIRREVGCMALVERGYITLLKEPETITCAVPGEVLNFIGDFDHDLPVQPFTFELAVPDAS